MKKKIKAAPSANAAVKKKRRHATPVPPEISEERERMAYELRIVRGKKLTDITAELNKAFPAYPLKKGHEGVRQMIIRVQDAYAKRDKERTDAILAESAATLDWVRNQSIAAIGVTSQPDKPIYLKRVIETVEAKSKLFGVMAAKKHELTGKDGAPLGATTIDLKALKGYLTDDDLNLLHKAAEILERAQRDLAIAVEAGDRSGEAESQS